ncbi:MAG: MerR family DNA-binding transcriptional regulator [Gammaproteobacteria bacterium]|uniref:MerR family transcriptional regulator n=1 Tax=Rhodoferax sp. TaxID=50421 RepID=UPI0017DB0D18|nr:MerR family DNA-binding transcriptional regulator [Rhodoferax sp.]MBU3899820.1 MerR family DNA-binding transcriptional regulator [Gammaproteobacteria bacterium]MBA3059836.1 MerR family DNA-binding transcriptional regulator [Rhodoferax sp.]MBU3998851.1 MerR family DNA-binding transcriptional regulator [Gammaproteobacteria bacterium]MBU4019084.1 MerR family DNA-binding transcriptional regulator [Gammaproteobacteria bacterium]MBU4078803.1 MerR family DNA-binding transcriptional regulator [Gamm
MASSPSAATATATAARARSKRVGAVAAAVSDAQAFVDAHRDEGTTELFGITELCQQFGITLRALRFYEDKGLLAPRRINGARVYTRRDRARLALILRAKDIGSPLSEIKRYLDLYGDHGEGRAQQLDFVIERTDSAIAQLKQKRAQIDETLAELQLINATCRRHLEERRQAEENSVSS